LQQGPPRARVDAVETSELDPENHCMLADFRTG
jgi:hypothetical protein